ncbi:hypothetical protein D9M70_499950 [compost metagenome]
MAERGDVVIGVEVAFAGRVVEKNAFAAHKMQRLFVKQAVGGTEHFFSAGDKRPFALA